ARWTATCRPRCVAGGGPGMQPPGNRGTPAAGRYGHARRRDPPRAPAYLNRLLLTYQGLDAATTAAINGAVTVEAMYQLLLARCRKPIATRITISAWQRAMSAPASPTNRRRTALPTSKW